MTTTSNRRRPVLIFDWDDTILPSSFVDQWNIEHFSDLPENVSNGLQEYVLARYYVYDFYDVCEMEPKLSIDFIDAIKKSQTNAMLRLSSYLFRCA